MNKKECERAIEIIDEYVHDYDMTSKPSIKEVNEAISKLDILISSYFKLADYLKSM